MSGPDPQGFHFGRGLNDGRGKDLTATRTRVPADEGKVGQARLFRKQMERLAELEPTPVYREMCAAAAVTRAAADSLPKAGNGKVQDA